MIYTYKITTSVNVTEASATRTELPLERGLIRGLQITFPAGSQGLLHLSIKDALHQAWPRNITGNFTGDDTVIKWDDTYDLSRPPYALQAYTWNEDDTYEHSVWIQLWIETVVNQQLGPDWLQMMEEERGLYQ